jgi:hypothetical protein
MRSNAGMKPLFRRVPLVAVVLAAGLATGARGGDDSPVHKIMDQVHTRNRAIGKGLRAPGSTHQNREGGQSRKTRSWE